jgi:hypothetical protein
MMFCSSSLRASSAGNRPKLAAIGAWKHGFTGGDCVQPHLRIVCRRELPQPDGLRLEFLRAGAFPRQVCAVFDLWQPRLHTGDAAVRQRTCGTIEPWLLLLRAVANHVSWLALIGSIRMQVLAGTQRSINDDAGMPLRKVRESKGKATSEDWARAHASPVGAHEALASGRAIWDRSPSD